MTSAFARPLALAALTAALVLTGCSTTPNDAAVDVTASTSAAQAETPTPTPTPEPALSLTGEWKSTNSASPDAWQSATITADTIEIQWVSDNGNTTALYWAGSYVAPTTADATYTWDSANDTTKTESAMLASSDPTKTFSYDNGVLSYSVTAMGVTKTVTMERVG